MRTTHLPSSLPQAQDEKILYINDSRRGHIRYFEVQDDGTLALGSDQVLCDLRGSQPGVPDGMKVDVEGNIYCGGSGGLWVLDARGRHLGTVVHGQSATTNLAFGGNDWKTLFFTSRNTLGKVQAKIAGVSVPAGS